MNFEEEREAWQKLGLNFFHYHVDLEFPEYTEKQEPLFFTKVNGATINQEKKDAFLNLDNLVEGKYYNGCFCTLEDGDKLGNFFDRLPYGIINKKITGIGATTLELRNCFEFLQKVFLGLMYSFSCVLWAIFWSFPLLFFVR